MRSAYPQGRGTSTGKTSGSFARFANQIDAKKNLIFSSNGGDGTVSVIRSETPDKFDVVKTIKTQVSAKTIAMDPETHRLYRSAATANTAPAAKPATKPSRRRYVPGSFVVLVIGE